MGTVIMNGAIISIPEISFPCPNCKKGYTDEKEQYYKKISKAKKGYARVKCSCGHSFGVAVDMTGDMVSFNFEHS